MSAEPDYSSGGEPAGSEGRRFSTLIGSLTGATKTDRAAQADEADTDQADGLQAIPARPTFTPTDSAGPDGLGNPGSPGSPDSLDTPSGNVRRTPAAYVPAPSAVSPTPATPAPDDLASAVPVTPAPNDPPPVVPAPRDEEGTRALPRPAVVPAAPLDEPLLSDAAGLRARWQRVQASFVDDPPEAVGDAADLIEQTAQALVGALRQRQRQLRVMWEGGPEAAASGDAAPAARASDTEHLRLMMMRYRSLFNQLCP
jgi:hypothetical protein